MSITEEIDFQSYKEDLAILIETLKNSFESIEASYHVDEVNETLYIKLEGLAEYNETEIIEIANPILEELDMDFEEIIFMPH